MRPPMAPPLRMTRMSRTLSVISYTFSAFCMVSCAEIQYPCNADPTTGIGL